MTDLEGAEAPGGGNPMYTPMQTAQTLSVTTRMIAARRRSGLAAGARRFFPAGLPLCQARSSARQASYSTTVRDEGTALTWPQPAQEMSMSPGSVIRQAIASPHLPSRYSGSSARRPLLQALPCR